MGQITSTQNQHLEKQLGVNFPENVHLVGMENHSNICYSNCILQALYHCEKFRERVLNYKNQDDVIKADDNPIMIMKEMFENIGNMKKRTGCITTKRLMTYVRKANELFKGETHQDCHEFCIWLLNEFNDLLKKKPKGANSTPSKQSAHQGQTQEKAPKTWLEDIFEGQFITQTECSACKNTSEREEPFLDISLDISTNSSLTYCMKRLSDYETLAGNDKFFCDKCKGLQEAQKRILIKQFPETLIIHLKRFKYDERYSRMIKLTCKIAFPVDIKLSTNYTGAESKEIEYSLYGVIIHHGQGIMYGHYTSLIRIKNYWFIYDDDQITVADEYKLFQIFGSQQYTSCAYMLFYEVVKNNHQNNDGTSK